ncbi:hypothetical protein B0H16DRAFT_1739792 [Mycena metata]|uniref:Uncharacterized protein n=1 Tax=Mycena metata TaxID=1033252 RepID=A0AAD7MI94_9AGAR|nr:hypothetical protein B0H16DRAFT_1739792 [Mycena metata]
MPCFQDHNAYGNVGVRNRHSASHRRLKPTITADITPRFFSLQTTTTATLTQRPTTIASTAPSSTTPLHIAPPSPPPHDLSRPDPLDATPPLRPRQRRPSAAARPSRSAPPASDVAVARIPALSRPGPPPVAPTPASRPARPTSPLRPFTPTTPFDAPPAFLPLHPTPSRPVASHLRPPLHSTTLESSSTSSTAFEYDWPTTLATSACV